MRQIIGIGEVLMDIIFKEGQSVRSVPGGSVFNAITTLGRIGMPVSIISEIGQDSLGQQIFEFMRTNGIKTTYIDHFPDGKTALAIAVLDENNDAQYSFYKDYPTKRLTATPPTIKENDILMIGSSYSIDPMVHPQLSDLLSYAVSRKALIFYDPNFRKSNRHEAIRSIPLICENMELADLIRGSDQDFLNLYNETDIDRVYKHNIRFYSPYFICTQAGKPVKLFTPKLTKEYPVSRQHRSVRSVLATISMQASSMGSIDSTSDARIFLNFRKRRGIKWSVMQLNSHRLSV